ncbi:MAG: hypothetical protein F4Z85_01285 [Gemmatimonadetes bacterium]|nr:hypothetical protein [Gemmatimonadota bacterium]MYB66920.1 hypothetical protein [Gemmatimonadota bacterium]
MARVQLVIPDEDRDRFVRQAQSEGMTLSEWLRAAACHRLEDQQRSHPFESPADLEEFFRSCDELEGPEREPDWQDHLTVIDESRKRLSNS